MYQIGKLVWREWNGCQEFWSWGIVYITLLSAFVVYSVCRASQHVSTTFCLWHTLHPFHHQNYTPNFKVTPFFGQNVPQSGPGKTSQAQTVLLSQYIYVNVGWVGQISEAKIHITLIWSALSTQAGLLKSSCSGKTWRWTKQQRPSERLTLTTVAS